MEVGSAGFLREGAFVELRASGDGRYVPTWVELRHPYATLRSASVDGQPLRVDGDRVTVVGVSGVTAEPYAPGRFRSVEVDVVWRVDGCLTAAPIEVSFGWRRERVGPDLHGEGHDSFEVSWEDKSECLD